MCVRPGCRQHGFDQVTVGIDQTGPAASVDVGRDEMMQKRALAHAGLAEDGDMPAAVVWPDAEAFSLTAKCRHPEGGQVGMLACHGRATGGSNSRLSTVVMVGARTVTVGRWKIVASSSVESRKE